MSPTNEKTDEELRLESEFLANADRSERALREGDAAGSNREWDVVMSLKPRLRQLADKGEALLKRIALNSDNPWARLNAAALLLPINEKDALDLLAEVATDSGLAGFSAQMTIQEWNNGALAGYLD